MTEEQRLSRSQNAVYSRDPRALTDGMWLRAHGILAGLLCLLMLAFVSACKQLTPAQKAQQQLAAAREDVNRGKTAEAIIEYRKALQADPSIATAHYELGQLYVNAGDYLNGTRQMTAAIELDGANSAARLGLADIFLLARNYVDAKTQADEVLSRHSGDPAALLVLAKSLGPERRARATGLTHGFSFAEKMSWDIEKAWRRGAGRRYRS